MRATCTQAMSGQATLTVTSKVAQGAQAQVGDAGRGPVKCKAGSKYGDAQAVRVHQARAGQGQAGRQGQADRDPQAGGRKRHGPVNVALALRHQRRLSSRSSLREAVGPVEAGRLFFCPMLRYPAPWQTLSMGGIVARARRHHHERGHRPDGDEPTPRPLDPAIREQGGVSVGDGEVIWPEPLLVGRSEAKLAALAARARARALDDRPRRRARRPRVRDLLRRAAHVGAPAGRRGRDRRRQARLLREAGHARRRDRARRSPGRRVTPGVKVGVVQDKLFLPGLLKLRRLVASGFFGRIIAARGEFGYWVYPGPDPKPQRPSWNYRREDGGGIISDMFAHWRYVLDNVFGPVRSVMRGRRHPHPGAHRRGRQASTRRPPRTPPTRCSSSTAGGRADELVVVRARESRRAVRAAGRRHATAAPSRACASARSSRRRRRRSRSGTRTCRTPIAHRAGVERGAGDGAARERLQAPVGAVPAPRRARRAVPVGLRSRARAASSSTSWASSRGASGAGSTCRS